MPSSHREGAWGLCEQSKTRAGALLAFCVNQGISASFSPLYFLIGRLRTTRFWSIKGPQHSFYWMSKIQSKLPGWLLKLLFFVWLYLEGLLYDQRAVFVFLIYNFIALISENVICTVSTFWNVLKFFFLLVCPQFLWMSHGHLNRGNNLFIFRVQCDIYNQVSLNNCEN